MSSSTAAAAQSSSSSSSCEEDVVRIKKKLEKMIKTSQIDVAMSIDMLNALKKLPVDLEVLKNTGIGVSLNNLRKNVQSEELGSLAKALLKNWKKLVSDETSQQQHNSASSPKSPNSNSNDSTLSPQSTATASNNHSQTNGVNKTPSSSTVKKEIHNKTVKLACTSTSDPVRQKSRQLLAQSLELVETIENGCDLYDCNDLAAQIEEQIFQEFKNTELKYKNRIRSRIANLKDPKNPKLRESVRLGLIKSDRFAKMTPEEMASDELKELRAKFTKESINDHQMARTEGAKTSLLKCGKCKSNNVTYTQMQTRSADEPMTTFAYCQECGHRWKFC